MDTKRRRMKPVTGVKRTDNPPASRIVANNSNSIYDGDLSALFPMGPSAKELSRRDLTNSSTNLSGSLDNTLSKSVSNDQSIINRNFTFKKPKNKRKNIDVSLTELEVSADPLLPSEVFKNVLKVNKSLDLNLSSLEKSASGSSADETNQLKNRMKKTIFSKPTEMNSFNESQLIASPAGEGEVFKRPFKCKRKSIHLNLSSFEISGYSSLDSSDKLLDESNNENVNSLNEFGTVGNNDKDINVSHQVSYNKATSCNNKTDESTNSITGQDKKTRNELEVDLLDEFPDENSRLLYLSTDKENNLSISNKSYGGVTNSNGDCLSKTNETGINNPVIDGGSFSEVDNKDHAVKTSRKDYRLSMPDKSFSNACRDTDVETQRFNKNESHNISSCEMLTSKSIGSVNNVKACMTNSANPDNSEKAAVCDVRSVEEATDFTCKSVIEFTNGSDSAKEVASCNTKSDEELIYGIKPEETSDCTSKCVDELADGIQSAEEVEDKCNKGHADVIKSLETGADNSVEEPADGNQCYEEPVCSVISTEKPIVCIGSLTERSVDFTPEPVPVDSINNSDAINNLIVQNQTFNISQPCTPNLPTCDVNATFIISKKRDFNVTFNVSGESKVCSSPLHEIVQEEQKILKNLQSSDLNQPDGTKTLSPNVKNSPLMIKNQNSAVEIETMSSNSQENAIPGLILCKPTSKVKGENSTSTLSSLEESTNIADVRTNKIDLLKKTVRKKSLRISDECFDLSNISGKSVNKRRSSRVSVAPSMVSAAETDLNHTDNNINLSCKSTDNPFNHYQQTELTESALVSVDPDSQDITNPRLLLKKPAPKIKGDNTSSILSSLEKSNIATDNRTDMINFLKKTCKKKCLRISDACFEVSDIGGKSITEHHHRSSCHQPSAAETDLNHSNKNSNSSRKSLTRKQRDSIVEPTESAAINEREDSTVDPLESMVISDINSQDISAARLVLKKPFASNVKTDLTNSTFTSLCKSVDLRSTRDDMIECLKKTPRKKSLGISDLSLDRPDNDVESLKMNLSLVSESKHSTNDICVEEQIVVNRNADAVSLVEIAADLSAEKVEIGPEADSSGKIADVDSAHETDNNRKAADTVSPVELAANLSAEKMEIGPGTSSSGKITDVDTAHETDNNTKAEDTVSPVEIAACLSGEKVEIGPDSVSSGKIADVDSAHKTDDNRKAADAVSLVELAANLSAEKMEIGPDAASSGKIADIDTAHETDYNRKAADAVSLVELAASLSGEKMEIGPDAASSGKIADVDSGHETDNNRKAADAASLVELAADLSGEKMEIGPDAASSGKIADVDSAHETDNNRKAADIVSPVEIAACLSGEKVEIGPDAASSEKIVDIDSAHKTDNNRKAADAVSLVELAANLSAEKIDIVPDAATSGKFADVDTAHETDNARKLIDAVSSTETADCLPPERTEISPNNVSCDSNVAQETDADPPGEIIACLSNEKSEICLTAVSPTKITVCDSAERSDVKVQMVADVDPHELSRKTADFESKKKSVDTAQTVEGILQPDTITVSGTSTGVITCIHNSNAVNVSSRKSVCCSEGVTDVASNSTEVQDSPHCKSIDSKDCLTNDMYRDIGLRTNESLIKNVEKVDLHKTCLSDDIEGAAAVDDLVPGGEIAGSAVNNLCENDNIMTLKITESLAEEGECEKENVNDANLQTHENLADFNSVEAERKACQEESFNDLSKGRSNLLSCLKNFAKSKRKSIKMCNSSLEVSLSQGSLEKVKQNILKRPRKFKNKSFNSDSVDGLGNVINDSSCTDIGVKSLSSDLQQIRDDTNTHGGSKVLVEKCPGNDKQNIATDISLSYKPLEEIKDKVVSQSQTNDSVIKNNVTVPTVEDSFADDSKIPSEEQYSSFDKNKQVPVEVSDVKSPLEDVELMNSKGIPNESDRSCEEVDGRSEVVRSLSKISKGNLSCESTLLREDTNKGRPDVTLASVERDLQLSPSMFFVGNPKTPMINENKINSSYEIPQSPPRRLSEINTDPLVVHDFQNISVDNIMTPPGSQNEAGGINSNGNLSVSSKTLESESTAKKSRSIIESVPVSSSIKTVNNEISNADGNLDWTIDVSDIQEVFRRPYNLRTKPTSSTPLPFKKSKETNKIVTQSSEKSFKAQPSDGGKVSPAEVQVTTSNRPKKKKSVTFAKNSIREDENQSDRAESCVEGASTLFRSVTDISVISESRQKTEKNVVPKIYSSTPQRGSVRKKVKSLSESAVNSSVKEVESVLSKKSVTKKNISAQVTKEYILSPSVSRRNSESKSTSQLSSKHDITSSFVNRESSEVSRKSRSGMNITSDNQQYSVVQLQEDILSDKDPEISVEFPPTKKLRLNNSRSRLSEKSKSIRSGDVTTQSPIKNSHQSTSTPLPTRSSLSSSRESRALQTLTNVNLRNRNEASYDETLDSSVEYHPRKRQKLEDFRKGISPVVMGGDTLIKSKGQCTNEESYLIDDGLPLGFSLSDDEEQYECLAARLRRKHPWLPSYVFLDPDKTNCDSTVVSGSVDGSSSASRSNVNSPNTFKRPKEPKRVNRQVKLAKPSNWADKKFYQFLFNSFKPLYGIEHRKKSEEFVIFLHPLLESVRLLKSKQDYAHLVLRIKDETKRLGLCTDIWEWREMCSYLPYDFRAKTYNCGNSDYDPVIDHLVPF